MKAKLILVGIGVVYKKTNGKTRWFIVKQGRDTENWELPKSTARRGESSVRAIIRLLAEQGGMRAKVLEEVGRTGGAALIGGNSVPQKNLYYLIINKEGNEVLGFEDYEWIEYGKAVKKLATKRDQNMLRAGNKLLKELDRAKKKQK